MSVASLIERVVKNDRAIVIAALSTVITASWVLLLFGAGTGMSAVGMTSLSMALGMLDHIPTAMATPVEWTLGYALTMFLMWWTMMVAMMLPSAAPMILLHAKVYRGARTSETVDFRPSAAFIAGYILAWAVFSALAAGAQSTFERMGVLSPMMMNATSSLFAALVLLFAGAYQLSPLKGACLRHCRGPIQFLSLHWRPGTSGALRMGLQHGVYCLGCCWGLMAILFFGGIMNLYWIIGLAVLVLLEKRCRSDQSCPG